MNRIRRDSIADQVYQMLNRAIEAGHFEPGARIFEDALARDLGISKTPLRLALHQLKRDGVIRIEPRKGIYLASPSLTEVIELIELREVLEGLAARRAAVQPKREFIDRMQACLSGFEESTIHEHRLKYAAADHRFHSLLVGAAASNELIKTLQVLNIRLHQYRLSNQSDGHDLRPIHRQHLAIVRALQSGDAVKSEELARNHVRHQLALKMLKEGAKPSEPEVSEMSAEESGTGSRSKDAQGAARPSRPEKLAQAANRRKVR